MAAKETPSQRRDRMYNEARASKTSDIPNSHTQKIPNQVGANIPNRVHVETRSTYEQARDLGRQTGRALKDLDI